MQERKINEIESLELITRMIQNTQQNLGRSNGNAFIVSGIATLISAIVVWVLTNATGNQAYQFAWFLIPIIIQAWVLTTKKREMVKTHIDKMLSQLWSAIGICCVAIPLIVTAINLSPAAHKALYLQDGRLFILIPLIEIIIVSIGVIATGLIIDFRGFKIAGSIGVLLAFGTLMATTWAVPYTFAIWAIACLIIPGAKLNYANKKSKPC